MREAEWYFNKNDRIPKQRKIKLTHDSIESDIQKFLKRGGKITVLPGTPAEPAPRQVC